MRACMARSSRASETRCERRFKLNRRSVAWAGVARLPKTDAARVTAATRPRSARGDANLGRGVIDPDGRKILKLIKESHFIISLQDSTELQGPRSGVNYNRLV